MNESQAKMQIQIEADLTGFIAPRPATEVRELVCLVVHLWLENPGSGQIGQLVLVTRR